MVTLTSSALHGSVEQWACAIWRMPRADTDFAGGNDGKQSVVQTNLGNVCSPEYRSWSLFIYSTILEGIY